jgi:hypothetical protein
MMCLRYVTRPKLPPEAISTGYELPLYHLYAQTADVLNLCVDFIETERWVRPENFLCNDSAAIQAAGTALIPKLEIWKKNLPPNFKIHPVRLDTSGVPAWLSALLKEKNGPGRTLMYDSIIACHTWNIYRTTCLRLHQVIATTARKSEDKCRQNQSMNCMIGLIEDICASVTCYFKVKLNGKPKADTSEGICSLRIGVQNPMLTIAMSSLNFLINEGLQVQGRHKWVKDLLDRTGEEIGIVAPFASDPLASYDPLAGPLDSSLVEEVGAVAPAAMMEHVNRVQVFSSKA